MALLEWSSNGVYKDDESFRVWYTVGKEEAIEVLLDNNWSIKKAETVIIK
jgi:hypothetical protein